MGNSPETPTTRGKFTGNPWSLKPLEFGKDVFPPQPLWLANWVLTQTFARRIPIPIPSGRSPGSGSWRREVAKKRVCPCVPKWWNMCWCVNLSFVFGFVFVCVFVCFFFGGGKRLNICLTGTFLATGRAKQPGMFQMRAQEPQMPQSAGQLCQGWLKGGPRIVTTHTVDVWFCWREPQKPARSSCFPVAITTKPGHFLRAFTPTGRLGARIRS